MERKNESECYGMHGEAFKHFKVRQTLEEEFETVALNLAEEEQIEKAVEAGNGYGAEAEN